MVRPGIEGAVAAGVGVRRTQRLDRDVEVRRNLAFVVAVDDVYSPAAQLSPASGIVAAGARACRWSAAAIVVVVAAGDGRARRDLDHGAGERELVDAAPFVERDELVDGDAELVGHLERVVAALDRVLLRGGRDAALLERRLRRGDGGHRRPHDERRRLLTQRDRRLRCARRRIRHRTHRATSPRSRAVPATAPTRTPRRRRR